MDKEIELKDLKNLINNMKDTVDLRALITDENVTESVTLKRGDNNGRD
jgi:ABC-type lipopolysaccharide export system ATPase subunit